MLNAGLYGETATRKAPPAAHPKVVGAAGLIAIAQHQLEKGNSQAAFDYATSASAKASVLEDYAQWIRVQAAYKLKLYSEVTRSATRIFDQEPASPFVGGAAAIAVKADLDSNNAKDALELIRKHYEEIPQPQADLLLAQCFQATGDLPQAAEYFQRVYYQYPNAKEATDAANALVQVKQGLGDSYPPPMPSAMIDRAQKLFDANKPAAAKIELAAAVLILGGAERDLARVRLGVADFLNNDTAAAFQYFSALKVDDPEADAERLSYLIRCARKLDRKADVKPFLADLEKNHPASLWRMDALIHVADQARVDNDSATYLPLYRACADTFPKEKRAAWCHWQISFDAYRHDSAEAYDLLRAHVQQYPATDEADDALYFLGRLHERKGDFASALACYESLAAHFPNTYYAIETRERLKDVHIQGAIAKPDVVSFLSQIAWAAPPQFPSFTPGPLAQSRLDRASLLQLAGLNDFAEQELKFGARTDGEQKNLYAMELAKMAAAQGLVTQAMHYIKVYAPGYLFTPLDEAPVQFWRLAFPIPYRVSIEQYSHTEGLDPFVVAALIRQESEFNATVISYANAYGLMQLLPSTGKELARHFRIRRFSSAQLLGADRNIQLGSHYFRTLLNSFNGQVELALASYNAGAGRANLWRTWGPFREQAEFVEAIPFHQTRGYVQIVLRNADVYRHLYAGGIPDIPVYHAKPAPKSKKSHRRRARHRPPD